MMKKIFFILLFLLIVKPAFAEVYKWVDEKGVLHFTDDIMQIPEKYRTQIERLVTLDERLETKIEGESSPMKKGEDYLDRIGRGEGYWRGWVEEWRKKLNNAQERVSDLRAKYNELTERFNDSKSSTERINIRKERDEIKKEIEKLKNQIEEAKYMLEKKIPEDAEIFKAKQEWIK
jgi:chromosome segregation ATPase